MRWTLGREDLVVSTSIEYVFCFEVDAGSMFFVLRWTRAGEEL
jgi:hypothetical protein